VGHPIEQSTVHTMADRMGCKWMTTGTLKSTVGEELFYCVFHGQQ